MQRFGIHPDKEHPFDVSIAEKAGEGKPEKVKGALVVSVDADNQKFRIKVKGAETEVTTNAETTITKDKHPVTFDAVISVGAKLDLEVLNGVAVTIKVKK